MVFRYLELALAGLAIVAIVVLFARRRAAGLVWFSALIMSVMAVHLFLEHGRWQLVPLYALVFVLAFWLARPAGQPYRSARPYRAGGLVVRIVIAAAGLAALALPVLAPLFRVPSPDGPHAVGSAQVRARFGEVQTDAPSSLRLWYPAQVGAARTRAPFWSLDDLARYRLPGLPTLLASHLLLVPTPAGERAPIVEGEFPLLLVVPGTDALPGDFLHLVLDAAASGWLVAVLASESSGADLVAVSELLLDPRTDAALAGRIDPERIAILRTGAGEFGDDMGFPLLEIAGGPVARAVLASGTTVVRLPGARVPEPAYTLRALMVRPSRLLVGSSDVAPATLRGLTRRVARAVLADGSASAPVFSGAAPDARALIGDVGGAVIEREAVR